MSEERLSPIPATYEPVVDWSTLDSFKALQRPGTPDIRKKLIGTYLATSPALIDAIHTALRAGDAPEVGRAAHSLKSSSMSIGAVAVGTLCAELEQRGKQNDLGNPEDLIGLMTTLYAATAEEFQTVISPGSS